MDMIHSRMKNRMIFQDMIISLSIPVQISQPYPWHLELTDRFFILSSLYFDF